MKINLYISYAIQDQPQLNKLLRWLYPMRDEINIWYNDPPPGPEPLPLPWRLLLFWYRQPDPRRYYLRNLQRQCERAHIYLFLTSYHAIQNSWIDDEITTAVQRYTEFGERYIRVYPVLVSPSHWQTHSRLAHFKVLGPRRSLAAAVPEEEGYLEITEQLTRVVKELQRNLEEEKFAQGRSMQASDIAPIRTGSVRPNVEEDPALFYELPPAFTAPEWLGWSVLFLLFLVTLYGLQPERILGTPSRRYLNVEPADRKPIEYLRNYPPMPPPPSAPLPTPGEPDSAFGR